MHPPFERFTEMKTKKMLDVHKGYLGLVLAAVLILVFAFLTPPEGMTEGGMASIGLFLAALVMWILEIMPMSVSALGLIALMPLLGILTFSETVSNFGVSTALFIMATSGITVSISNSTLPLRLTCWIMRVTKGNSRRLILYFGIAVSVLSAFMSSLATCALFFSFALVLLRASGCRPGKSNLGRCLMMILPACGGIGGFMSPAGTPSNIVLMEMMEGWGIHMTFAKWSAIGFPLGLLATVMFSLWLPCIFPPEQIDLSAISDLNEQEKALGKLTKKEIKSLAIVCSMIILWFLGSWVSFFTTTTVALLGLFVMFLPGIGVLDWKTFSSDCNWNLVFVMGSVSILMVGVTATGAMDWIAERLFSNIGALPPTIMFIVIAMIVCMMRAFIPTTTAVVALFAPMLVSIATITGQSLAALLMIPAFWAPAALLLVYTEPIYLITFGERYYSASDLLKVGWLPSLMLSIVLGISLPAIVTMLGF